ncbi:hypothetical protein [Hyphobacterium sp.]|uniref:hypothetical protein n=1 Tax=Hyphobacterium sp. TaxID=2004662 RepID=UPI003BAA52AF
MVNIIAALLAFTAQDGGFTDDPEILSQYMVQSCLHQQVTQQGGEPVDYIPFCTCLDDHLGTSSSAPVYRAMALGSQGAIGEYAQVDDPAGALAEAQRIMGTVEQEEMAAVQANLQSGLSMCLARMPGQSAAE